MEFFECGGSSTDTLASIGRETYFDTFHAMNTRETMERYLNEAFHPERIREELKNPDSRFFLVLENNETAGYFKINRAPSQTDINDPESLELERIYVRKDFQGRGIGGAIIAKVSEIALSCGCRYIWLGVWIKNTSGITFYEKNGFVRFSSHFFRMGEELQQDVLFRKDLK